MSQADTFQGRVKSMIKRMRGVKPLARRLGISDTAIHSWFKETSPFDSTLEEACTESGISLAWLRDGDGNEQEELAKLGPDPDAECGPRGRLTEAMKRKGLNASQLAKKIGYQIGPVQAIFERGTRISESMAEKIVEVLPDLTLEELLAGSDTPRIMESSGSYSTIGSKQTVQAPAGSKVRAVPFLSWAQAGTMTNFEDDAWQGEMKNAIDAPEHAFILEIRGDSMEPRISPGDHVLVCPTWEARNGDTVICRTVKGDVMCKLYQSKFNGQFAILSSYNPAYPPQELSMDEIVWIYPVKDVTHNLRSN